MRAEGAEEMQPQNPASDQQRHTLHCQLMVALLPLPV